MPFLLRLISALGGLLLVAVSFAQTVLPLPRHAKREGFTRVVLDLPPDTQYLVTYLPRGVQLRIPGVQAQSLTGTINKEDVESWTYASDEGGVTVQFKTPYGINEHHGVRFLPLPPSEDSPLLRLVLDFSPGILQIEPFFPPMLPPFPANTQVVLDPGHGGSDPGATGGVIEKEVTLKLALQVREYLMGAGAWVTLTREQDTELSPTKNTDLRARAAVGRPPQQYFVSIHVNSDPGRTGAGIETWYYAPRSKAFAEALQNRIIELTNHTSRGVKSAPFVVIKETLIPAALVEVGFASHLLDAENLRNEEHLKRIAFGIARAIRDQYPEVPPTP